MARISGRAGWAITLDPYRAFQERWVLDGIRMTMACAQDVVAARPGLTVSYSMRDSGTADVIELSGIELTAAEARAIAHGADPVTVLLPGWPRARKLTMAELTA
jgi:hypothetical protein